MEVKQIQPGRIPENQWKMVFLKPSLFYFQLVEDRLPEFFSLFIFRIYG